MPTVAAILRLGGILLCLLGFSGDAAAALVQILSHRSGDEVPAGEVILLVKVTLDPGQALRELSVRIDGAPAGAPADVPGGLKTRSIAVDAQDLDPALHRLRLVLSAGSRQVEVTPLVTTGTATPARITLQARSASEQDPLLRPRLYALIVGISRYHDPALRLRFPTKDAADLAAVLRRQAGGLYRDVQVRLLTDEGVVVIKAQGSRSQEANKADQFSDSEDGHSRQGHQDKSGPNLSARKGGKQGVQPPHHQIPGHKIVHKLSSAGHPRQPYHRAATEK